MKTKRKAKRWGLAVVMASTVLGLTATAEAEPRGAYFVGELGGDFSSIPIYEELGSDANCEDHCRRLTSVVGVGPTAEFRLAPVFRSYFGFDGGARGYMGYLRASESAAHLTLEGHVSGRVYVGFPWARAFAGYEYGHRSVSITSDLGSGEASFRVHSPMAGVELCLGGQRNSPKYCDVNLGFDVAYERPGFGIPSEFGPDGSNRGHRPVLNGRLGVGNFFVEGSLARGYPAANPPGAWSRGGRSGVESSTGRMASIGIGLSGDIMNDGGGSLGSGLELVGMLLDGMESTAQSSGVGSTSAGFGVQGPSIDEERDFYLEICDVWKVANSGGHQGTRDRWDISDIPPGAEFDIRVNAYSIPDRYEVDYPGSRTVLDTGWRGDRSYEGDPTYSGGIEGPGREEYRDVFRRGFRDDFEVRVFGEDPQTRWKYSVRCRT